MPAADPEAAADSPGAGSLLQRLFGSGDSGKTAADTGTQTTGTTPDSDTTPAAAPQPDPSLYQGGMAALQNKNYHDAATQFQQAARAGDAAAQFQLGSLYYQGLGVNRDYSEAMRWYSRAATAGNAEAQYSLGNMYLMGEGTEQSDQQALFWYQKAAAQGHDSARRNLENLKTIMNRTGEKPGLARGDAAVTPAPAAAPAAQKRGFFSRLFGSEDKQPPAAIAQHDANKPAAQAETGAEAQKPPSYMSKEGGGLLGHLFGRGKDQQAQPAASGTADTPAATTGTATGTADTSAATGATDPGAARDTQTAQDKSRKQAAAQAGDKPSVMSKEGGGLFGYLFGWGKDKPSQQPSPGDTAPDSAGEAATAAH